MKIIFNLPDVLINRIHKNVIKYTLFELYMKMLDLKCTMFNRKINVVSCHINIQETMDNYHLNQIGLYRGTDAFVLFCVLIIKMYYLFILMSIVTLQSSATIYRKTYQDQTSWSFQHPTTRYTKARFDKSLVKSLGTMTVNTPEDVSLF